MKIGITARLVTILMVGSLALQAAAQTPKPPVPPAQEGHKALEGQKTPASSPLNPVIVQNVDVAPQVVTILHRLSGLKVFRLLVRSHEQPGAIANLDEAFKITNEVHTNVIAGLALDDGRTIAAWLPEAEAEMPPPAIQFGPAPPVPSQPPVPNAVEPPQPPSAVPPMSLPGFLMPGSFHEANLKVVTRDGKRVLGHYVGLDGLTGLSVITLPNSSRITIVEPKVETIKVGQRLHVIGPQPAPRPEPGAKNAMYVRIGQTDATVVDVTRSSSGGLARIKIKSGKLSAANIGGIAVSEAGETLGIVDAVQGSQATIVPVALVRSAVKRVIERQASVPRPWLGIKGEPIHAMSLEKILEVGWQLERARELCEKSNGILLTSVVPGSPAAQNLLKPGDVILSVNNEYIRNAEDFTWLLQEAGPGTSVNFTVARPNKAVADDLKIKLTESPDPFFGRRTATVYAPRRVETGSLMSQGIETIAIRPKAASRFGAAGGLLVVSVQPATPAFKAGMRPGDVIEAVDGQQLSSGKWRKPLLRNVGASSAFSIVRNKQKLVITIPTHKHRLPAE
jgi:S1-C subfamily serine protease